MDLKGWIIAILVGAVAGWLASLLMGKKKSLLVNIILGIIGGFVGTWLFGELGINLGIGGILGAIVVSTIGAIVLIAVLNIFLKSGFYEKFSW